jgi:hypothetical protein
MHYHIIGLLHSDFLVSWFHPVHVYYYCRLQTFLSCVVTIPSHGYYEDDLYHHFSVAQYVGAIETIQALSMSNLKAQ